MAFARSWMRLRPQLGQRAVEGLARRRALQLVVDREGGSLLAGPQALDRMVREQPVRGRLFHGDAELLLQMPQGVAAARQMAGQVPADLDAVAAGGRGGEVRIEGRDLPDALQ